eukprot:TRINITY_DN29847_c0_g1_i1.p1 TRINITY_DN29847_c0_g1~~TRINITY_DN29847_c0_g1_i1.p1  ORF type:complete len:504 (+),score=227.73 TRINITY_DN29847_c0_g1_i1:221-1513(+)
MPQLPKPKKKVKMDREAREAAIKARLEAEAAAGDSKASKKLNKRGGGATGHAAAAAARPTASALEGAPPGMEPIYMGNDIIGWIPIKKEEEKKPEAEQEAPDGDDAFIPSEAYAGSKYGDGYVFQQGPAGLGYYFSPPPTDVLTLEAILEEKKKAEAAKGVHFDPETTKERERNTYSANADGQAVPCGRFSSLMATAGNYIYLYGGQFEEGSREVTLSDMFRLNMNTLDTFECVQEMDLSKQDWYESEEEDAGDEEGSDEEGGAKRKKRRKGRDDSEEGEEDEEGEESGSEGSDAPELEARGTKKPKRARNKREELRQRLGADEGIPTPDPHQVLRDFFSASLKFWTDEATSSSDSYIDPTATDRAKAIRREAFRLASMRYHECRPILEQIEYLDNIEKQEAEWRAKKAAEAKEHDLKMKKLIKKQAQGK